METQNLFLSSRGKYLVFVLLCFDSSDVLHTVRKWKVIELTIDFINSKSACSVPFSNYKHKERDDVINLE